MKTLGDRIKYRREELSMSQEELARRIGYKTSSSINKIEAGINDIPQSKLALFAEALDCTLEYLVASDKLQSNTQIGQKIEKARKEAGLTQSQLAEVAHVAEISIRKYEAGDRTPKYDQIKKIAQILKKPVSYFMDDQTDEYSGSVLSGKSIMEEMNIGSLIREHRIKKGMSMKELGALIGVSEQAISQYELGKRTLKFKTFKEIASVLDISLVNLVADALGCLPENLLPAWNESQNNILSQGELQSNALIFGVEKDDESFKTYLESVKAIAKLAKEYEIIKEQDTEKEKQLYSAITEGFDNLKPFQVVLKAPDGVKKTLNVYFDPDDPQFKQQIDEGIKQAIQEYHFRRAAQTDTLPGYIAFFQENDFPQVIVYDEQQEQED